MVQCSKLIISTPSWDSGKPLQPPGREKKGGFHRNFNMQRQIRDTTGLSTCTDLGKNDILRHPSFLLYTWQRVAQAPVPALQKKSQCTVKTIRF
ncbi:MAG: hypothetical protein B1H11_12920 [Desulfobacteraceae bacterium 4484_190.1]|nr:MAG: hypothetical protein B1H11_12920 [Desulfobacteraceae bacterium 4484_190.1]